MGFFGGLIWKSWGDFTDDDLVNIWDVPAPGVVSLIDNSRDWIGTPTQVSKPWELGEDIARQAGACIDPKGL